MNSDVKTGTSLSGGLDSSSIFTLMNLIQKKENLIEDDLDLNPIIMDYEEMKTKEDAVQLSQKFKRNYQIVDFKKMTADKTMDLVSSLEVVEEYFMQFELYKKQKEKGIKVSLDGHGADEFLGYPNWIPELSVDIYNSIANNFKTINKFGKTQNINKFKRLFGNYGYPLGNLKGKKAVVFCTYGSPQFAVRTFFLNMPTKRLRRGVFNICGITDVIYRRYFAVPFVGDKKRKKFLEDVKKTANNI